MQNFVFVQNISFQKRQNHFVVDELFVVVAVDWAGLHYSTMSKNLIESLLCCCCVASVFT